jgi:hypothetical protein
MNFIIIMLLFTTTICEQCMTAGGRRNYTCICLKGLRNTTLSFNHESQSVPKKDMNMGHCEYEEVLPTSGEYMV